MDCSKSASRNLFTYTSLILGALLCVGLAVADSEVIITEIHYNPDGPDEAREFIELKNVGDVPADVSGWQFTNGVIYTFPEGTSLDPGEFYVIVSNSDFFSTQYPGVAVGGQYIDDDGAGIGRAGLTNRGERLTLKDGPDETGLTVFSLRYYDGNDGDIPDPPELPEENDLERALWPSLTDAGDHSLVSFKPNANPDEEDYRNWRPSINLHGSPGADEPLPSATEIIYINEVRTRDGDLDNDAIELYNPGSQDVNVGGWFVTDNLDQPVKNPAIASDTVVPASGYIVLENGLDGFSLSVSSKGERVFLYSASEGVLTGWVHGFHLEASEDKKTFARFTDAEGNESLINDEPSLGFENGSPLSSGVTITEIMYSPAYGSSVEYVKIKNNGTEAALLYDPLFIEDNLSVGGFGITIPGPQPTLAVGEEAFVTNVTEVEFRLAYDVDPVARVFADSQGGGLNGGGELIELRMPLTIEGMQRDAPGHPRYYAVLDEVQYDDDAPWPSDADGQGFSLVRKVSSGPGYAAKDWVKSDSRGGNAFGGGVILISEILSHTDLPQTDVIELYNPGTEDVDIGGWYLTDAPSLEPTKYVIPNGSVIPAGGYWAVNEDNNAVPGAPPNYFGNAFSISSRGDQVFLFSGDGVGGFTGYSHGTKFRATANGVSLVRYVNSAAREIFVPQSGSPSVEINLFEAFPNGFSNRPPLIERAVISEILYEPAPGGFEFVEITNISGTTLALYDTTPIALGGNPNSNWSLDGVTFTFPGNQPTLDPGQRVVVIPQGVSVGVFRSQYNVPEDVTVYGEANGFIGALNNGGEEIALLRPDKPDFVAGVGIVVPMIQVDSIHYNDSGPWPSGVGKSIERIEVSAFGDDPANWQTTSEPLGTPGRVNSQPAGGYNAWAESEFTAEELQGQGVGPADDFDADGVSNLLAYAFYLSPKSPAVAGDLPWANFVQEGETETLTIYFQRRADADDLLFRVQRTSDLVSWSNIDDSQGSFTDNGNGTLEVSYSDPAGLDGALSFLRVVVELDTP